MKEIIIISFIILEVIGFIGAVITSEIYQDDYQVVYDQPSD